MLDQAPNGSATRTPASDNGQDQGGSWFDRAFRPFVPRRTEERQTDSESQTTEQTASETTTAQGTTPTGDGSGSRTGETPPSTETTPAGRTTPAPTGESETVTMSRAEITRMVQAETDREINRRERLQQDREVRNGRVTKRKNALDLLSNDVNAGAEVARELLEEEEQAEQQVASIEQQNVALSQMRDAFDGQVIRPVLSRLPREAVEQIVAAAPAGIEGRAMILQGAIERMVADAEKRGELKARQALRTDPTFRKQALLEWRGDADEPDSTPAAATSDVPMSTSQRMSRVLRDMAGVVPQ